MVNTCSGHKPEDVFHCVWPLTIQAKIPAHVITSAIRYSKQGRKPRGEGQQGTIPQL